MDDVVMTANMRQQEQSVVMLVSGYVELYQANPRSEENAGS